MGEWETRPPVEKSGGRRSPASHPTTPLFSVYLFKVDRSSVTERNFTKPGWRGGATVGRRTCDQEVASSVPFYFTSLKHSAIIVWDKTNKSCSNTRNYEIYKHEFDKKVWQEWKNN